MSILWTGLLALGLLSGHGATQSCKPELEGVARNFAKHRPAFQSTHMEISAAAKAVDGNCNGDFGNVESCSHTSWVQEPWWYVDLGERVAVSTVVVKNRGDCCAHRIWGAEIHVGDSLKAHGKYNFLCGTITDTSLGTIIPISCYGFKGRYVSIIIPNRREYLQLCEVEVYGTKMGNAC